MAPKFLDLRGRGPILAAALLVLPAPALARSGPGMADMRSAQQYAARAATAHDLPEVRARLRHALNCLRGRKGPDHRRSAGEPCSKAGAFAELPTGSANKIRVGKAIRLAAVGVTFHDFDPAHFTALAVNAVLLEGVRTNR